MPRFANDQDSTTQYVIDEWKLTAASEVDDIGGWREHTDERSQWSAMPKLFYSQTSYLVGEITAHYPGLDAAPLLIVYGAAAAWHTDHNAKRLLPQHELTEAIDKSCVLLNAVATTMYSRSTDAEKPMKRPPGRPPKQKDDRIDKVAKRIIERGQDAGRTNWFDIMSQYGLSLPKDCTREKLRQRVKKHRNRQNKSANK